MAPSAVRPTIRTASSLTGSDQAAVEELLTQARSADGFAVLNEAAQLHLRHPRPDVVHLLARRDEAVVGYAQLEPGATSSTAHLVVVPAHRRTGVGSALLAALGQAAPSRLQLWAIGDSAAALALARTAGLVRVRKLLIMSRDLSVPLPRPETPVGVAIRAFRPGQDEDNWLGVNARAFAGHPEQGALTRTDLDERVAESWFDPAGFLLAERDGKLLGFHWTKQHPGALGEVYVLGVDPQAGGAGLGTALLLAGLAHLAARGNRTAELYVAAGSRAVGLYASHGFVPVSRDVMYTQP
jgi:mycothiol synthase